VWRLLEPGATFSQSVRMTCGSAFLSQTHSTSWSATLLWGTYMITSDDPVLCKQDDSQQDVLSHYPGTFTQIACLSMPLITLLRCKSSQTHVGCSGLLHSVNRAVKRNGNKTIIDDIYSSQHRHASTRRLPLQALSAGVYQPPLRNMSYVYVCQQAIQKQATPLSTAGVACASCSATRPMLLRVHVPAR